MSKRIFAVVLATLWMSGLALHAHEGNVHIMGTIASIDANHVAIKDKDGKTHHLLLTKTTKYRRGKAVVPAADLKVGERAVVDVVGEGSKAAASEIRLGEAPAAAVRAGQPAPKHKH